MSANAKISKTETFTNSQGLNVAFHTWAVAEPRAVVVGVHGLNCHARFTWLFHKPVFSGEDAKKLEFGDSREYVYDGGSWAQLLNAGGIELVAIDLQSHGDSESHYKGSRTNVRLFEDFTSDVIQLLKILVPRRPDVRHFVMGHSMGGCITMRVSEVLEQIIQENALSKTKNAEDMETDLMTAQAVKGYIPIAPMLSLKSMKAKPLNRILAPISGIVAQCLPRLPVTKIPLNPLFPHLSYDMDHDPVCVEGYLPAKIASECLKGVKRAVDEASRIGWRTESSEEPPPSFLFIHSNLDDLCDAEGSTSVMALMKYVADKQLIQPEKMWHMLTIEPGAAALAGSVVSWISQRTPSSGQVHSKL